MKRIMIIALSAGALAAGPALSIDVEHLDGGGAALKLSAPEAQACAEQGGCAVFTRAQFQGVLRATAEKAFEAGKAEAKKDCRNDL